MATMNLDSQAPDASSNLEDVVLELEWVVHEATRKQLRGEPADRELEDIDRLIEKQVCIAIAGKKRRQLTADTA